MSTVVTWSIISVVSAVVLVGLATAGTEMYDYVKDSSEDERSIIRNSRIYGGIKRKPTRKNKGIL